MKKIFLVLFLISSAAIVQAQVEVAKLVGKNSDLYKIGYGAFLKAGVPLSEQSEINGEIGLTFFLKNLAVGMALV